jgi:hypothetical protein
MPMVDGAPKDCVQTGAEVCGDGLDNDCDLRIDCSDTDCSGVGTCPVCGVVENPEVQPLALPDGTSQSTACTTNADCTNPAAPNCVQAECHASYTSTLNFVGFPVSAGLNDVSKLLSVCVKMEHSWLRDLQMDLITPDDRIVTLHGFVARSGAEVFLGDANDGDQASNPVPGVGYQYCWKPGAPTIMLGSPTVPINADDQVLPAGDYAAVSPWSSMMGVPLNGPWTMRVTDLWSADNGFMFEWSISFDPSLVLDCSGPIIL